MNLSHYRTEGFEQIRVTVDGYQARALLTRFAPWRTWSVRGTFSAEGIEFPVVMHDGDKKLFLKSTALKLAENFIVHGREFL